MIVRKRLRLLSFSALWPILLLCALSAGARADAANVVFATGSATVIGVDGKARKAERGSVLAVGETVDTSDGKAQLRFRDGATISLQPGTQFRVEQYRFTERNGRASDDDNVAMRLLKGTLRAVSGLIGKERREQYRMDTMVGTIGIRGTEYGASLGDAGLAVTTYVGLVEVCNSAGCAMAGAGQALLVADGNTRPRLQPGSNLPNLTPGAAMPQLPTPETSHQPTAPVAPAAPPPTAPPPSAAPTQPPPTYSPTAPGPSLRGGY